MSLESLIQAIDQSCHEWITAILAGKTQPPLGLRRSARLPMLAALHEGLQRSALQCPILLITDRADHALTLMEELAIWTPQTLRLLFPEPTPLFYEDAAWGETTRRDRLAALTTLASYHVPGAPVSLISPLLIVPARALMTRTMPRRDFLKATRTLHLGQAFQPDNLARSCVLLGYEHVTTVIASGQFARRGGILDLWPPAERQPVRLEFFGEEIETMRRFNPATQRTIREPGEAPCERVLITPAREFLIKESLPEPDDEGRRSEFFIPLLHTTSASLLDYLPRQSLVVIDDRQALEDTINEVEEQALLTRKEAIKDGTLPENFPVPYLTWLEILDSLTGRRVLDMGLGAETLVESNGGRPSDLDPKRQPLADRFTSGPRFGGRLKSLLEYMVERKSSGDELFVVSRQSARLKELWEELPADVQTVDHVERAGSTPSENERLKSPLPPSGPMFIEGSLGEGWIFEASDEKVIHLLTDGEIFGWRRPEPRQRAHPVAEAPEANYTDLQVGDYVVHVDHGLGRFIGLVRRTVDEVERDYLCLEYSDEAQLFVPVHQADRLTRYVGPDSRTPALDRLGSPEWRNVKSHVKEAVREVAEDLLELYARRSVVEGFAFSPDTPWQGELEASFSYIETEDQIQVLGEVKHDMQSSHPMDRLICGDVGYGKTEVALRAAFKAVMDGRQVAILVPTTILAQQHFNTFKQRLAAFPVEVEMLSRFRTPQQQGDILERLFQGKVDMVIGTHRLLSSDVRFKDLGLLVIDEEQRFGVTHKETLKKMRTEVDVLTLTATPIPRTLYMTLSGVRDISTINTPPEERLPVVTHVGPYSPRLVRQAILRELERGGQVFFVHNRVQTIGAMSSHLKQLIPEARLAIAHGQMDETELAVRMEQFTAGEIDILLSTSIIESGLDIPNANTLIVDRADTFGLAQLYQLRGRVGRGAQRAYAYFFRHKRKPPTFEGRQRLETIAENTRLGAGFSIAMGDLEIRGSGDILGTRQHGHIAAVGFHLYTALLSEAVIRMRREQGLAAKGDAFPKRVSPGTYNLQLVPVNVELPLPVGIPAGYVPDQNARLGLYRRMADMRSIAELEALVEEFKDRFGPLTETVENLFYQLKLKLLVEKAGLISITTENGQIVLRYPDNQIPTDLPNPGPLVRVGKAALWIPYEELDDWPGKLLGVLENLQPDQSPSLTS